ncbi:hypothetical protein BH11MYX3_BH11MYX3_15040 [soil metagenome]
MRAVWLAVSLIGACTPDIVPGAYLCGPDESCPERQVCNGADNTCVLPGAAVPFACGAGNDVEPNDDAASALAIPNLTCAGPLVQLVGCASGSDAEDWFAFDVPPNCNATVASLRLSYPIAFEQLSLRLASTEGDAATCGVDSSRDDGSDQQCVTQNVTAGTHYTVRVARNGTGNCDGACAYNRYTLTLQLGTP